MNREPRKASQRRGELWSISWRRNLVSSREERRSHRRQRPVQKMTAWRQSDGDGPTGSAVQWVEGKSCGWESVGGMYSFVQRLVDQRVYISMCLWISESASFWELHSIPYLNIMMLFMIRLVNNVPPSTHAHSCNVGNPLISLQGNTLKRG